MAVKNIQCFLLSALILSSCAVQALAFYHPDDGRWLSRDPIEEQGGLNVYVFVNNNPLSLFDPFGLAWVVTREGASRAKLTGTCGDKLKDLDPYEVRLDLREYSKWLKPNDGDSSIPGTINEPLAKNRGFTIPNKMYVVHGTYNNYWEWVATWPERLGHIPSLAAALIAAKYSVTVDIDMAYGDAAFYLGNKDTYGLYYFGHGGAMFVGTIGAPSGTFGSTAYIDPDDARSMVHHALGVYMHAGCKTHPYSMGGKKWSDIVSVRGIFGGTTEDTTPYNSFSKVTWVIGTYNP